ncbi:response regulator receiver domain-containing protein [Salipiger aestuarii]|uniref:Response regulator receiver domain-containing protein n=1 Tax=Salipiger aestuarii TaxID=568098 RepID=A0A327XQD8_9RHOB|nr:response regulator [Salipiger aestuarii]EIE52454.1 two component, sigma54 specific, transcriptional regulator, Fis family protein [Citreicella sp. 357]RAK11298.1 response regulator receiver domain-containing protein [Salipiger aestuarii]
MSTPPQLHAEQKTTKRMTALVLDDEEADRYRLMKICTKAGLDLAFDEAESVAEMEPMLDDTTYDIVFIDYHLGIATGQDALEYVLAHPRQMDAVAIMVTSVDRHDVIIQAMRTGCHDYLIKEELGIEALRKSVASAFERNLMRRAQTEDHARIADLEATLERIDDSLRPEMRRILSSLLRRIRSVAAQVHGGPLRLKHVEMEELCTAGLTTLDEVGQVCDANGRRVRLASKNSGDA